nr:MAG TPA: hypothetical protein [Caudoviricetes sp.]
MIVLLSVVAGTGHSGRWRHHRHNLVNYAVCSLGGASFSCFWYRPFYTTHKSITGRRAHYPIHPGGFLTAGALLCCVWRY